MPEVVWTGPCKSCKKTGPLEDLAGPSETGFCPPCLRKLRPLLEAVEEMYPRKSQEIPASRFSRMLRRFKEMWR